MRLLWAGVLVLLPLMAEFASAQRCSGTPDEPEHATVRCFRKKGTCRATCQGSYIFSQKNAKSAIYDCEGGNWVMRGGEDRCTPECDPTCDNGECIAPGICECDDGFTGDYCEEEEELEEAVCMPNCMNGGYCTAPNYCTCPYGYSGYYCEKPECDPPCDNGECIAPDICECDDGFTGDYCEEKEELEEEPESTTEKMIEPSTQPPSTQPLPMQPLPKQPPSTQPPATQPPPTQPSPAQSLPTDEINSMVSGWIFYTSVALFLVVVVALAVIIFILKQRLIVLQKQLKSDEVFEPICIWNQSQANI